MSEDQPEMEGWAIRAWPFLAAMLAVVIVLALALALGAHRYRATIALTRHRPVHVFSAPDLDGFDNPARPTAAPPHARPLNDAALRAAATRGDALLQDAAP